MALRITPVGEVSGTVLGFGETCLQTDLAVRGRAVAGVRMLRIDSQFSRAKLAPAHGLAHTHGSSHRPRTRSGQ